MWTAPSGNVDSVLAGRGTKLGDISTPAHSSATAGAHSPRRQTSGAVWGSIAELSSNPKLDVRLFCFIALENEKELQSLMRTQENISGESCSLSSICSVRILACQALKLGSDQLQRNGGFVSFYQWGKCSRQATLGPGP